MLESVTLVGGPLDGQPWQVTQGTKSIGIPCTADGTPIVKDGSYAGKVRGGWLVYDRDGDGKFKFDKQTH
jgi:hypothetical protein